MSLFRITLSYHFVVVSLFEIRSYTLIRTRNIVVFSHHILTSYSHTNHLRYYTTTDNPLQQILAAQEETAATKQELTQVKEEMARTIEAIASAQQEATMANEQVASMKEVG